MVYLGVCVLPELIYNIYRIPNQIYRGIVGSLLLCLVIAMWIFRRKWIEKQRKVYGYLGYSTNGLGFWLQVSDAIWFVLILFQIIFVFLIPIIISGELYINRNIFIAVFLHIVVAVWIFVDTYMDLVITEELCIPPIVIRIFPINLLYNGICILRSMIVGGPILNSLLLFIGIFLFVGEMSLNLLVRKYLHKR